MSAEQSSVRVQPIGKAIRAETGTALRDLLFDLGVEFPCGGNGTCRGCRIRVLEGHVALNALQEERLSKQEIDQGWRLACQCRVEGDLSLELRQWDAAILSDDTTFAFTPQDGLGIAVDVGTTTLVAQLLDLSTGHVLGVKTALNPQARHGGDVMSRVQFAVAEKGHEELQRLIRAEIGKLARMLLAASGTQQAASLRRVVLVGNTVMHHLFCGIDLEPLSHYPFEAVDDGLQTMTAKELGWECLGSPVVEFLPCLGSFVGSDLLAGVLATGLHRSEDPVMLIDLGTNGEIVLGNKDCILCASTAAGPAFEGARIHAGMRASTGAIWKVEAVRHAAGDGTPALRCETLGNVEPRGICGSGLVDAVAVGLDLELIGPNGRLADGLGELPLAGDITLTQTDIRQLQLAKGAIAAGARMLMEIWSSELRIPSSEFSVTRIYLAGAFGNYVDRDSARRIGLLNFPIEWIEACGNTALLGAKQALFCSGDGAGVYETVRAKTRHVSLNEDACFLDFYVEAMHFPKH